MGRISITSGKGWWMWCLEWEGRFSWRFDRETEGGVGNAGVSRPCFQVRKVKDIEDEWWEGRQEISAEGEIFWSGTHHKHLRSRLTPSDDRIAGGNPNRISFLSSPILITHIFVSSACEKAITFPAWWPCLATFHLLGVVCRTTSAAPLCTYVTGAQSCVERSLTCGCEAFCAGAHTPLLAGIAGKYATPIGFWGLGCVAEYFHAGGYHNRTSWRAKQSIPSPSAQHQHGICHFSPCITSFLLHSFCCHCFVSHSPISPAIFPFLHPSRSTSSLIRGE